MEWKLVSDGRFWRAQVSGTDLVLVSLVGLTTKTINTKRTRRIDHVRKLISRNRVIIDDDEFIVLSGDSRELWRQLQLARDAQVQV